MESID